MPNDTYDLMRNLTSPIVAVTARVGDRVNGQIANSAGRAWLIPTVPRVLVSLAKYHLTHDMVEESGHFALHLLRTGQLDLVHRLGFHSGREGPKLLEGEWTAGESGSPVFRECYGYFDCKVFLSLDVGPSTLFIGSVLKAGRGEGEGEIMTSPYWREHMPEEWRPEYERQLVEAQEIGMAWLAEHPEFVG